jgi:lipopolysaccharide biosynthesis glycosyltransferase
MYEDHFQEIDHFSSQWEHITLFKYQLFYGFYNSDRMVSAEVDQLCNHW